MEFKVLRENTILQVAFTFNESVSAGTVVSEQINFNDCFTLRAKVITLPSNSYERGFSRVSYQNIVLINIEKVVRDDKTTYKMKLSCPEFKIQESIFYSDDGLWRVINENTHTSPYTFTITLQAEALTETKFSILYEDEQLTDYKLKGEDGEINIHKAFLAATSNFFRSKLLSVEENAVSLKVPDTSVNTLQNFKRSIYTEMLPDENIEELLLVASYFKISWLEYKCVDKMMKNMSSSNAIKLLEFALQHRHMPLFLGIMDYVQGGGIKMSEIRKHYLSQ